MANTSQPQGHSVRWPLPAPIVAAIAIVIATVGVPAVAGARLAADTGADADRTIVFGAHPSPLPGQSRVDAARSLQNQLGTQLGAVRRYLHWEDDPTTDPLVTWTIEQGSRPHISVFPQRADRTRITWAEIANAPAGSQLDQEIRRWAQRIAALDVPVWFTFHHEPETVENQSFGTDQDFTAAWRRIVDTFNAEG